MIPCLFKSNAINFDGAGLGQLDRVIDCKVKENLNGTFELNMQLLRDDPLIASVEVGAIIYARPNQTQGNQPFVIEQITKGIDGVLEIYATHIAQYKAKLIPIQPYSAVSLADTLDKISNNSLEQNLFTFHTDKSVNTSFELKTPRSLRDLLGGMEGSILDIYGGEYLFDNYNIFLFNKRGRTNTNINIMYGENMTEYRQTDEFSWIKSITGILPYYYKQDQNGDVYVQGDIQYSNYVDYYPYHKTIPYDFSDKFTDTIPTIQQLNDIAYDFVNNRGLTQISIEASFEDITTLPQYNIINQQIDVLQLGDYVNVVNSEYNLNITTRIRQLEYDVLLERYSTITIGDATETINDAINGAVDTSTTNISSGVVYSAGSGIDITNNVISNKFTNLSSVDLNDIKYYYMGYVSGGTNVPTSNGDGYLIVVGSDTNDRCFQMWKVRSSNNIWHRYFLNNSWSTWTQLANVT